MKLRSTRTRVVTVVACAALGVVGPAAADGTENENLPGDNNSVPFWPHETGALMGTSETFVDMQSDGSYYDASVGRRVFLSAK
jgi:hypothetical protein